MARILMLTSRLPFPPGEGHQLRAWHLLRAMSRHHDVTLLSFLRKDDDLAQAAPLRGILASLETFPIPAEHSRLAMGQALLSSTLTRRPFLASKYDSAALRDRLAELSPDADLVHIDMLPLMQYADLIPRATPVVYNAHNVEHLLLDKRSQLETRPLHKAFLRGQVPRLRAFEQTACRRADLVLACSRTDATTLQESGPGVQVLLVPNGVDLDANQPAPAKEQARPGLVFVGQMGWFPNRDGVEWFLDAVFPRILARRPDAEFVLVGKSDGMEIPDNVAARVRVAGFVPDLRPLVHDAAVYVVPLRAGSGTRLKVLEAMALGKAIVSTRIGSEGIDLHDGENVLFADDADSFAAAVLSLFESPQRRARLGDAARACAQAHYGWDAIGRTLLDNYDGLLVRADG